jgi:hypothetical protein
LISPFALRCLRRILAFITNLLGCCLVSPSIVLAGSHADHEQLESKIMTRAKIALSEMGIGTTTCRSLGRAVPQGVLDAPIEVREDLAALLYALHEGGKVVVDRDHVGGLLRDVRVGHVQGDTRIGACEHGAVVDAVSGDTDDATETLGTLDDLELVPGQDTCEDNILFGEGCSRSSSALYSKSVTDECTHCNPAAITKPTSLIPMHDDRIHLGFIHLLLIHLLPALITSVAFVFPITRLIFLAIASAAFGCSPVIIMILMPTRVPIASRTPSFDGGLRRNRRASSLSERSRFGEDVRCGV